MSSEKNKSVTLLFGRSEYQIFINSGVGVDISYEISPLPGLPPPDLSAFLFSPYKKRR